MTVELITLFSSLGLGGLLLRITSQLSAINARQEEIFRRIDRAETRLNTMEKKLC